MGESSIDRTHQQGFHHLASLADEAFLAGELEKSSALLDTLYGLADQSYPKTQVQRSAFRRTGTRRVRLCHNNLPTTSFGIGCRRIARAVSAHPDLKGVIEIDVVGFGDELTMMGKVRDGSMELAVGVTSVASEFCPEIGILDTPFLFQDVSRGRAAFDGALGDEYAALLQAAGINVLGWLENGVRHMTANRPIRCPEDMEGLKLRVPQSHVCAEAFQSLGASSHPLPFGDTYDALKTRQLDAQEAPLTGILASKFDEVQRFLCLTGHNYSVGIVAASDDFVASLTPRHLHALRLCIREGTRASRDVAETAALEGPKKLQTKGMSIIKQVDTAGFRKAMGCYRETLTGRFGADRVSRVWDAS